MSRDLTLCITDIDVLSERLCHFFHVVHTYGLFIIGDECSGWTLFLSRYFSLM